MGIYVSDKQSIFYRQGMNIKNILETISTKYIGDNPANPYIFRATPITGFRQLEDGRVDMNFNMKFADSDLGDYGYGFGLVYCDEETENELSLSCYGPTQIYLNGELFYKSQMYEDVNIKNQRLLDIKFKKGFNEVFIKMLKTSSGFGCIFGSSNSKWFPIHFYAPFPKRQEMGGFVYSYSRDNDYFKDFIPSAFLDEEEYNIKWYPQINNHSCNLERIFGRSDNKIAYSWSSFEVGITDLYEIQGNFYGETKVWIDNELILTGSGSQRKITKIDVGHHDILIESVCDSPRWEFDISISYQEDKIAFQLPQNIKGSSSPWIFLGTFEERKYPGEDIRTLYKIWDNEYWRIDKDVYIRPYLENDLYGKWNYPLGVTLYGLLKVSNELNRMDIRDYVIGHILECSSLYEYSLWDKQIYGSPAINHQIVELDMLDDCGSFGSAMLEAYNHIQDERLKNISDIIANYIIHKQERKEDGAFYRRRIGNYMENTLWADDLYMSIPFLIRYYKLTGDEQYINEAVNQFLLFKKYLYIEDKKIMSHVYDFKYNVPTYVPWGRGNGWVIFSLSELLEVLPSEHIHYKKIVEFFNQLSEGYRKLQGANGLWHQVLTDSDSYEETSCTAMFIYAFCRGLRNGWLSDKVKGYIEVCSKGIKGIIKNCIDQKGNVYGVCQGSGYSFTPLYYKEDLTWTLNDTHGIGIVLLAIAEYHELQNWII